MYTENFRPKIIIKLDIGIPIENKKTKETPWDKGCPDPKSALFVTWTKGKKEDLRGCIGTFDQSRKLSKVLKEYALISSQEDDRFGPISFKELPNL